MSLGEAVIGLLVGLCLTGLLAQWLIHQLDDTWRIDDSKQIDFLDLRGRRK